jgi:hypothetical protein
MNSELELYAGADGWAAMHSNEWVNPRLPFISCRK